MKFCLLQSLLLPISFFFSISAHFNNVKPTEQQKDVLQKTVQELLDFKRLPEPGEVMRPVSRTAEAASKYMHKLFEQYKKNGHLGYAEGNIVRSISPVIGDFWGEEVLFFKLNTIKRSEQVIRAELHYNVRHKHRSSKSKAKKIISAVGLCDVSNKCEGAVKLHHTSATSDWICFDATSLVSDALHSNLTFIMIRFLRKGRPVECHDLVRRNTPFLLIYSNSPSLFDKEKFQSALYPGSTTEQAKRTKRSPGYYAYSKNEGDFNEEDRLHMHVEQFRSLGPKVLRSRKEIRKSQILKQRLAKAAADPMMGFGTNKKTLSETMDSYVTGENSSSPKNKEDLTVVLLGGTHYTDQKCGKRNLVVEFRDIGWEHWVIAPPSFEAHYCSGACPFPLNKDVNPSNHAIIQSIIHTIGVNPYVPAVCCAPDKMDSLTLLYFDEMDNVVLKNYPKMTVSSCACL